MFDSNFFKSTHWTRVGFDKKSVAFMMEIVKTETDVSYFPKPNKYKLILTVFEKDIKTNLISAHLRKFIDFEKISKLDLYNKEEYFKTEFSLDFNRKFNISLKNLV